MGWKFSVYSNGLVAGHHVSVMSVPHTLGFCSTSGNNFCISLILLIIMHSIQLTTLAFIITRAFILPQCLRVCCGCSELHQTLLSPLDSAGFGCKLGKTLLHMFPCFGNQDEGACLIVEMFYGRRQKKQSGKWKHSLQSLCLVLANFVLSAFYQSEKNYLDKAS